MINTQDVMPYPKGWSKCVEMNEEEWKYYIQTFTFYGIIKSPSIQQQHQERRLKMNRRAEYRITTLEVCIFIEYVINMH